jgi:hypothetical protein
MCATVDVLSRGCALGTGEKAMSGSMSNDADELKWLLQRE